MSDRIDFGSRRPQVLPSRGGYRVPFALVQEERPRPDGTTEWRWFGYSVLLPFLSELELDQAIADLPPGDYSEDRQAALLVAVQEARRGEYPPVEDYLDAVVKGDQDQLAAYTAACLAVKQRHPLP